MSRPQQATSARRRLAVIAGAVGLLSVLFATWTWTPLADLLDPVALHDTLAGLPPMIAGLALVGLFALAAALFFPVTPLILLAMVVLGPLLGAVWSLAGLLLAAQIGFVLGRLLGRRELIHIREGPIYRASRFMRERGLLKTTILRVLPIAHFPAISFLLGISHLRWSHYMGGTLLGSALIMLVLGLMYDRTAAAVSSPSVERLVILGGITLGLIVLLTWLQRRGRSMITGDTEVHSPADGPNSC